MLQDQDSMGVNNTLAGTKLRDCWCLAAEEHVARVKAEGEAEDFSRRLTVAQEQIAEYALERHSEVAKLLEQADNLQASLHKVDGESSSNEGLSTVGQRAEVRV